MLHHYLLAQPVKLAQYEACCFPAVRQAQASSRSPLRVFLSRAFPHGPPKHNNTAQRTTGPHHDLLRLAHIPRREPAAFCRSRSRQSLCARAERRLRRASGRHRRVRPHDRSGAADVLRGLWPCSRRRGRSCTLHGDQARGRRLHGPTRPIPSARSAPSSSRPCNSGAAASS